MFEISYKLVLTSFLKVLTGFFFAKYLYCVSKIYNVIYSLKLKPLVCCMHENLSIMPLCLHDVQCRHSHYDTWRLCHMSTIIKPLWHAWRFQHHAHTVRCTGTTIISKGKKCESGRGVGWDHVQRVSVVQGKKGEPWTEQQVSDTRQEEWKYEHQAVMEMSLENKKLNNVMMLKEVGRRKVLDDRETSSCINWRTWC